MRTSSVRRGTRGERGFTLPEVLVSVAMVAVLAAVVLPAVLNQIGKSEVSRAVQDFQSLDAASQVFRTDIGRWPGHIQHLLTQVAFDDPDLRGQNYDPADILWNGPYLSLPSVADPLPSGGGVAINAALQLSTGSHPDDIGNYPVDWLFLEFTVPDADLARRISLEIDGPPANGWHEEGRIRAATSTGTNLTAYFFAVPAK